jgi:glycosyltransferase involved in cell wall biosynthesis
LIFTARRLTLRTGVFELVQAMPQILERTPSARLAIAGEGHHRPVIEREIARSGLGGSVRLLGRIDDADLLRWYRAADLSVTPTQHLEGFGLATGESLAVGTPALVTPVGANAELVRDLDPLLVASGCAPADLADSLVRLVEHPGALAGLRCRARAHAHPRWAWSTVAATYLDLYRAHLDP